MRPDKNLVAAVALAALVLGFALGSATARAEGDAVRGQLLAETWCAECHMTAEGVASDAAPQFDTLMTVEGRSPEQLTAWLLDPHPPMPKLALSTWEIRDLVAYLLSLQKQ